MLHLIFQSPLQSATLQRMGEGDAIVFLENAVLHLLKNSIHSSEISALLPSRQLFVLTADIETRGISPKELSNGIQVIDYSDWVMLTTQHQPVQSWF